MANEQTTTQADIEALLQMMTIRRFEENIWESYRRGLIPGLAHLSLGQEAVAVGTCGVLSNSDYVLSTHRGHGHCIAKGADVNRMMAEMLGKVTGYCRGRGGTMHIADIEHSNLGAMAIVGAGFGMATGVALACKKLGEGRVVVSFIGEGAMNGGITAEAMNLAALWQVPLIFVCENNIYSEYTAAATMTAGSLLARANAYGLPASTLDGMRLRDVRSGVYAAVERARRGDGPTFLEFKTYRLAGHHVGDQEAYRSKAEVEEWRRRDPIDQLATLLIAEGALESQQLGRMWDEASERIRRALEFAIASQYPSPDEVEEFVYA